MNKFKIYITLLFLMFSIRETFPGNGILNGSDCGHDKDKVTASPANVNFKIEGSADEYNADRPADSGINIDVDIESDNWTITCIAEPLVRAGKGDLIIPAERLLVKLETPGGEFVPMAGPVVLGVGSQPTQGKICVNRLWFKLVVLEDDENGSYHGIIHILLNGEEKASINVHALLKQNVQLACVPDEIHIDCSGEPGFKEADQPAIVTVESNRGVNELFIESTDLVGPNGRIRNDRLLISVESQGKNNGWHGFERMGQRRQCPRQNGRTWSVRLLFQVETIWKDRPGVYTGEVIISEPESGAEKIIRVIVTIHETVTLRLSTKNLYFQTIGIKGECYADKPLTVGIATNYNSWILQTEATDLSSNKHTIPKDRIAVKSSEMPQLGFMALNSPRKVAEGTATAMADAATLDFRITYMATDLAGEYTGTLIFRALGTP